MKTAILFLVILGAIVLGVGYYTTQISAQPTISYRTATVTRGDLVATISATGTVEPEEVVDVGAQVVGRIKNLGADPRSPTKTIDYGSVVQEGTVLANIDDAVYKAQEDQARAALLRAKADLLQYQAKLLQAQQEFDRAESLRPTKAIADTDYDVAMANFKAAKANVAVGEAVISQAEAALRLARTNLDYTVIKSPVQGVIIDRRVNIGQTVVASLNAPSLFLIAKDLRKMQVWASVNEADIGRIREQMPVSFTVDAFPGETFVGRVVQIRLNATMTQNVVTYTVVVATDNSSGRLKPYLTANLQFEIEHRKDVLMVPNAAMRWKPRAQQVLPEFRDSLATTKSRMGKGKAKAGESAPTSPGASSAGKAAASGESGKVEEPSTGNKSARGAKGPAAGGPAAGGPAAGGAKEREEWGRLWLQAEGTDYVRPISVQFGATDGSSTEVRGQELSEGMEVVIGETRNEQVEESTNNLLGPPKFFRGNRKKTE